MLNWPCGVSKANARNPGSFNHSIISEHETIPDLNNINEATGQLQGILRANEGGIKDSCHNPQGAFHLTAELHNDGKQRRQTLNRISEHIVEKTTTLR